MTHDSSQSNFKALLKQHSQLNNIKALRSKSNPIAIEPTPATHKISVKKPDNTTHLHKPLILEDSINPAIVIYPSMLPMDQVPQVNAGGAIKISRNGFSEASIRKWCKQRPSFSLDWHGMTIEQTNQSLQRLFNQLIPYQSTLIEIIHGKGNLILKSSLYHWLEHLSCLLFAQAIIDSSGQSGALFMLIKYR